MGAPIGMYSSESGGRRADITKSAGGVASVAKLIFFRTDRETLGGSSSGATATLEQPVNASEAATAKTPERMDAAAFDARAAAT